MSRLLPALSLLGYESVEEVLGVLQAAGRELGRYLGVKPSEFEGLASALQATAVPLTADEQAIVLTGVYSLGVALERIPFQATAPDLPPPPSLVPAPQAAPATVSHIPDMPPIRDQAARGTCVAFAALAAYEHFLHRNGTDVDLSEQFLYWNCKAHDGYPAVGTWLRVAYELLERDGCCLEEQWPYVPDPVAGNEGQGPPSPGAQLRALPYRLGGYLNLSPTSVVDLRAAL